MSSSSATPPLVPAARRPVQVAHSLRTYLIEDSSIIRDNLVELLMETIPMTVVGSSEDEAGAKAWLLQNGHDCDLVIVDIFLKHGSGLGALALNNEFPGAAKWIVLSNHATIEMRSKCLELGADAVFDKSNEIEALLLYCKQLVGMDVLTDVKDSLTAPLD